MNVGTTNRPRLLLIAFSCDPHLSMEDRNGWYRAVQASAYFDVTVFCGPHLDDSRLNSAIPTSIPTSRIRFVPVPVDRFTRYCLDKELLFYIGYRRWMAILYSHAKKLELEVPFTATQMVSLCGYREPGPFWKLPGKYLLGPIGGTSGFPLNYLGVTDLRGGIYEVCRNVGNASQLWLSSRIKLAAKKSAFVFSANSATQADLKKCFGVESKLELETGIDFPIASERGLRPTDRPFRILWAGRIRAWKGLPILIRALARLRPTLSIEVRVVGDGAYRDACIRLAKSLKVNNSIDWIERPFYRDSLEHYRWADIFAFTSLRDTSGTGLLEALAMGAPIIGLNHQGAFDIMTDDSCVRISSKSPSASIEGFASAIEKLSRDPILLKSFSDNARRRAHLYQWENRQGPVEDCYRSIATHAQAVPATAPSQQILT